MGRLNPVTDLHAQGASSNQHTTQLAFKHRNGSAAVSALIAAQMWSTLWLQSQSEAGRYVSEEWMTDLHALLVRLLQHLLDHGVHGLRHAVPSAPPSPALLSPRILRGCQRLGPGGRLLLSFHLRHLRVSLHRQSIQTSCPIVHCTLHLHLHLRQSIAEKVQTCLGHRISKGSHITH